MNNIFDLSLEVCDLTYNSVADLIDNTPMRAYNISVNHSANQVSTLTFEIPSKSPKIKYLLNEELIKFESEYYFIKNPRESRSDTSIITVECEHISSGLTGVLNPAFEIPAETAQGLITEVLKGTNWICLGSDAPSNVMRHLITSGESSVFENLVQVAQTFGGILEFKTDNNNTHGVYLRLNPIDKGASIEYGLNLQGADIERTSNEIYTRLTMFGAVDDETGEELNFISKNPTGNPYIEDFTYYTKRGYTIEYIKQHPELFLKECVIRDSSITDEAELYRVAQEKLAKLSKPVINATIEGADLSLLPAYMLERPVIGEKIMIKDPDIEMLLEAQVVGVSKNFDNPLAMSIDISNVIVYQDRFSNIFQNSEKIDKIIGQDNKINGLYIKEATIDTAHIRDLSVTTAKIQDAQITTAKIKDAQITSAKIGEAQIGSAHIMEGVVGDAHISDLNASKLRAGRIDTALVKISSRDGEVEISGYQVLVNDTTDALNKKNRVILGKYKKANSEEYDYGLVVRSEDGQTVMIDGKGVHNAGITDGSINDNKISDDANINGAKIDINSFIRLVNEEEGIETIKGSKIYLDDETLDVVMSGIKIAQNEHSSSITSSQGKITVLEDKVRVLVETIDQVKAGELKSLNVISTNGNIFRGEGISTDLVASIYSGGSDITTTIPDDRVKWTRNSGNTTEDNAWAVGKKGKILHITTADVKSRATFTATLYSEPNDEGTQSPMAVAGITLMDYSDTISAGTAPGNPTLNQLWIDTSTTPSVLKRWTGTKWEIINDISELEKEVDGIYKEIYDTGTGLKTTLTQAKSDISTLNDSIKLKSDKTELESLKNRQYKVRYIRTHLNGNDKDATNRWVEVQALVKDLNILKNVVPTSNMTITNSSFVTDGVIDTTKYTSIAGAGYLRFDLGAVREDIDFIQVWHYYADSRQCNSKIDVSEDGNTWYVLYDNTVSGKYKETQYGKAIPVSFGNVVNSFATRIKSAEIAITPDSIIQTVRNHQSYQDDLNDKASVEYVSAVEQKADGITTRVEKTESYSTQILDGIRCQRTGAKFNYSSLTTSASGRIYLHGYDENNNASAINGQIKFGANTYTVKNGEINVSTSLGEKDLYIYIAEASHTTLVNVAYYDDSNEDNKLHTWRYKNVIGGTGAGAFDMDDGNLRMCIGQFRMNNAGTGFAYSYLYNEPQHLPKAISALSPLKSMENRVSYAETQITAESIISKVETTINTVVSDKVSSSLDNIQIGGTNLVPNSTWNYGINADWTSNSNFTVVSGESDKPKSSILQYNKSGLTTATYAQKWCKEIEINADGKKQFTVSFDFKTPSRSGIDSNKNIACLRTFDALGKTADADAVWRQSLSVTNFEITEGDKYIGMEDNKWYRACITFVPVTGKYLRVAPYITLNGIANWREFKVEEGNKATSWSVSFEDIGTDLNTVRSDLQGQLDGKIETWSQSTDPSLSWTVTDKTNHKGDLWYNTGTKETKRWDGASWIKLEDADAKNAEELAKTKKRVFTAQPTTPYEVGDLWLTSTTGTGDLYLCKTARASGNYTASDWGKAVKYTDDTAVSSFINNTYSQDLIATQNKLDQKTESYYQATMPYPEYTNVADNADHNKIVGDLWYNSTPTVKKSYIYTKTASGTYFNYKWQQQEIPADIFNTIDGKKTIYTAKPTSYEKDDLWIVESDIAIAGFKTGDLLTSTTKSATYNASHWIKKIRYTDDSSLNSFISGVYSQDLIATQNKLDQKTQSFYQTTMPYPEYTNVADNVEHNKRVGDLWYNSTSTVKKSYIYTKTANGSNFNYKWLEQEIPADVFDVINGKKTIYTAKPTSYEKDDLWIIENDTVYKPYLTGDLLTSTTKSSSFVASHWIKKIRYTDDTVANSAMTLASSVDQKADSISLRVTKTENYTLNVDQGIRCHNVGYQYNKSSLNGATASGHIFMHGYTITNGVETATNTGGIIFYNNTTYPVANGDYWLGNYFSTFGTRDIYICIDVTNAGITNGIFYDEVSKKWKQRGIINSSTLADCDINNNNLLCIGQFSLSSTTAFKYVFLLSSPLLLKNAIDLASLEKRVSSAELKITDEAIIGTVTKTIDDKVAPAVATANNALTQASSATSLASEAKQTAELASTKVSRLDTKTSQFQMGLRCHDVGMQTNKSSLNGATANGYLYMHGYKISNNVESESATTGYVYYNNKTISSVAGALNIGSLFSVFGTRDVYLCCVDGSVGSYFGVYFDETLNKWRYRQILGGTSVGDFDLSNSTYLNIGRFKMVSATIFTYAYMNSNPMFVRNAIDLQGYESRLSSAEQKITADAITSTVSSSFYTKSQTDDKLDNINVGGRNLLKETSSIEKEVNFGGWDYYFPNNIVDWKEGEELTGRIYLKPTAQEASCMLHVRYTDSTYTQIRGNIIKPAEQGYSKVTTLVSAPTGKTISHIQFSIRHSASTTPTDIVKYKEAKVERGNKATDWTPATEDIQKYTDGVVGALGADLQGQLDGKIETWSQSSDPSTAWTTTDLKDSHKGDLWYNTSTKETKRWSGTAWVKLEDGDAKNAEALAQEKKRVFTSQPAPPYEVGDLWVTNTSSTGDLKMCKTARTTGSYTASDWVNATKYTDDTTANAVNNKVTTLTQTVDGFTFKTSHSGTGNLLANTSFKHPNDWSTGWWTGTYNGMTGTKGCINNTEWSFPDKSVNTAQLRCSNQSGGEFGFRTTATGLIVGRQYTLGFYSAAHRITSATLVIRGTTSSTGSWNSSKAMSLPSGGGDINNWAYTTHTFTAQRTDQGIEFNITNAGNDGYMWVAKPMLVEGSTDLPWTLRSGEVYEGITVIDESGVRVLHNQSSSYSHLNSEGLKIFSTSNRELASFGEGNKATIAEVHAPLINSDTVVPQLRDKGDLDCYVAVTATGDGSGKDQNNRANSVITAIKNLFSRFGIEWSASSGCVLTNTNIIVHIWWGGTLSENVILRDFLGNGRLEMDFGFDMTLTGRWEFYNCTYVLVDGERTNHDTNNGALFKRSGSVDGIMFYGCQYAQVNSCRFNNSTKNYSAISAYQGTNLYVNYCDFYQFNQAIYVYQGSRASTYMNRGHGFGRGAYYILGGSYLIWERAYPNGGLVSNTGGWGTKTTGEGVEPYTANSLQASPPAPTNKVVTADFTPVSVRSVRSAGTQNGTYKQGYWESQWGNYNGYANFGSNVSGWLSDASGGVSMQVYLERMNDSHGYASAVPVIISGNNIGTLNRGEGKWFTLPSAVVSSLQGGGELLANGSGQTQYIKFVETNIILRVTATKPV